MTDQRNRDKTAKAAPRQPYKAKQARNLGALLALVGMLALLAIGGIVYVLLQPSEDPDTIRLPEHTTRSLAEDQPLPPPVATTAPMPTETMRPAEAVAPGAAVAPETVPAIAPQPLPAGPETAAPPLPLIDKPALQHDSHTPTPKPISALNPHQTGRGVVAIVIDDMGVNVRNSKIMATMPASLTFAYLPYAPHLGEQTAAAYGAGHELIVHMPMEPDNIARNNPGPDALLTTLPPAENQARLERNLHSFDHYMGINNHMGSRMTANAEAMRPIIANLKEQHLWFLDSKTSGNSVSAKLADEMGVPYAERDVFLDNVETVTAITAQLQQVEGIAARRGYAVAIGHPHDATIAALKKWLAASHGEVKIVPLSAIIALRFPQAALPQYARAARHDDEPAVAVNRRN